jgi:vacuolar-type H+-ATPase subunit H
MKLIQDIKNAEDNAEKMIETAETEGQTLLEKAIVKAKMDLANLDQEKEQLTKVAISKAKKSAQHEIEKLEKEQDKKIEKLERAFTKNKEKALKSVQEIILKWPSAQ